MKMRPMTQAVRPTSQGGHVAGGGAVPCVTVSVRVSRAGQGGGHQAPSSESSDDTTRRPKVATTIEPNTTTTPSADATP